MGGYRIASGQQSMIIRRGPRGRKQRFIPWSELNCRDNAYKTFVTLAEDTLDLSFAAFICLAVPPVNRIYLKEAFSLWEAAVVPLRFGVMPSEREARIFQRDSLLQGKSPNHVFPRWGQLLSPLSGSTYYTINGRNSHQMRDKS